MGQANSGCLNTSLGPSRSGGDVELLFWPGRRPLNNLRVAGGAILSDYGHRAITSAAR